MGTRSQNLVIEHCTVTPDFHDLAAAIAEIFKSEGLTISVPCGLVLTQDTASKLIANRLASRSVTIGSVKTGRLGR